jgi:acyl-CoA dehydrogenase
MTVIWLVSWLVLLTVIYHRVSLLAFTAVLFLLLVSLIYVQGLTLGTVLTALLLIAVFIPLNIKPLRYRYLTKRLLQLYRNVMPVMSRTEREALAAGTVTWEADLFRGNPDWHKLLAMPVATLTEEEQAFISGPVEELCRLINDWDITHNRLDLPPEIWTLLKEKGFFGLGIPRIYGGKEFSAFAHSQILTKISGLSVAAFTTVAVPNSLGPAELLLHYGTEEQKQYYLPRLARGEEIPCFALSSPEAGSDAGAMIDYGIVCWGEFEGEKTLGIKLNWNKRYITLAPIATVIGLAFKLYDPDHLIGKKEDIGITCALIPRNTPGVTAGRRHFPLNAPFQNGPTQGKDVFIPLSWIIGGVEKAGKGWGMLMECLAAGRAISLPASAIGGAKAAVYTTGAYAHIRRQFHQPVGNFEGIEEALGRIGAYTYLVDATRRFVLSSIDQGEKPSVASAIVKYHTTELGRKIACDAMDIHGGKGICLGPNNYLGRGYESAPIAITVEGANILTRSMIIFGQGAIRCHPYVFAEMEAARLQDDQVAVPAFDKALFKHIGFALSNVVRSLTLGLTGGLIVLAPKTRARRYYQQATRFCSAFALLADVAMLTLGGNLKRKESLSARLGDILSYLYLLSALLKHWHEQGEKNEDYPFVSYAGVYCLYQIQESFNDFLRNFPNRGLALLMRLLIFPLGCHFTKPKDKLNHKIAQLIMEPSASRTRLTDGAFITNTATNNLSNVQDALVKTIAAEPIDKILKTALKEGKITGYTTLEHVKSALDKGVISSELHDTFMQAYEARHKVIAVDDFTNDELIKRKDTPFYAHLLGIK